MSRCAVTRRLPGSAVERLAALHDVSVWPHAGPPSPAELRELASGVEGLLTLVTDTVDAELLAVAPALRVVSNYAVGVDNIDLQAAAGRRIQVGHTPDILTETTADLAFALLAAAARRVVEADAFVRAGRWTTWDPHLLLGAEIYGATLGIIGPGRIGAALARRARGFDMTVLMAGRDTTDADLTQLLRVSDFVSLHCPLTDRTRGLLNADRLAQMKPGAALINTARGGLVDLSALATALGSGRLGAAALDTTDPEPLPHDHPILSAPRTILTPHIGSATLSARSAMADIAVDNLLAGLEGRVLPHPVALPAASSVRVGVT